MQLPVDIVSHNQLQVAQGTSSIHTPAGEAIVSGDRLTEEHGMSSVAPLHENGTIRWTNVPRQPIPPLDDINLWVGHQLNHKRLPKMGNLWRPWKDILKGYWPYQMRMAPHG